jgi:hypothetical protein
VGPESCLSLAEQAKADHPDLVITCHQAGGDRRCGDDPCEGWRILVRLNVNSADVEVDDRFAASPLLWVLRDVLGLRGTKYGCGIG